MLAATVRRGATMLAATVRGATMLAATSAEAQPRWPRPFAEGRSRQPRSFARIGGHSGGGGHTRPWPGVATPFPGQGPSRAASGVEVRDGQAAAGAVRCARRVAILPVGEKASTRSSGPGNSPRSAFTTSSCRIAGRGALEVATVGVGLDVAAICWAQGARIRPNRRRLAHRGELRVPEAPTRSSGPGNSPRSAFTTSSCRIAGRGALEVATVGAGLDVAAICWGQGARIRHNRRRPAHRGELRSADSPARPGPSWPRLGCGPLGSVVVMVLSRLGPWWARLGGGRLGSVVVMLLARPGASWSLSGVARRGPAVVGPQ